MSTPAPVVARRRTVKRGTSVAPEEQETAGMYRDADGYVWMYGPDGTENVSVEPVPEAEWLRFVRRVEDLKRQHRYP